MARIKEHVLRVPRANSIKRAADPWTGHTARMWIAAGVLAVMAVILSSTRVVWAQGAAGVDMEIRARGGSEKDLSQRLTAENVLTIRKAFPPQVQVEQYVFTKLEDGTVVVGLDPVTASLRHPGGVLRPRFVAGRSLKGEDSGQPVAVVGKRYAETRKTAFGYKIAGMVYPGHVPNVLVGDTLVKVVGIFETGSADGDNLMVAPLAFAQTLASAPQNVNLIVLRTRSPAEADATRKTLEASLGDKVDIRVPGK